MDAIEWKAAQAVHLADDLKVDHIGFDIGLESFERWTDRGALSEAAVGATLGRTNPASCYLTITKSCIREKRGEKIAPLLGLQRHFYRGAN